MAAEFKKQIKILASMCDNTSKLSVPSIFALFMDLASEHAPHIGLGSDALARQGLFWLTVRTKVRIHERPALQEVVEADTWPEKPGQVRCNRYYTLSRGGALLVEGKTEWAMLEMATGKLHKISEAYPAAIEHRTDTACAEPFVRISEDFSDAEKLGEYTVRSTDIDLGQHMNNAAYVRALFGAFSCRELGELAPSGFEIAFRTPCFEGDKLAVRCRRTEGALELGMLRADGKAAVVARMRTGT